MYACHISTLIRSADVTVRTFREESFLEAIMCNGNAKYFHDLSYFPVPGRDLTSPLYSSHLPWCPIKREVIGDLNTFTDLDLMPESILSDSFNFLFQRFALKFKI